MKINLMVSFVNNAVESPVSNTTAEMFMQQLEQDKIRQVIEKLRIQLISNCVDDVFSLFNNDCARIKLRKAMRFACENKKK
jgi:uncharacterized protein YuzB (UPF0349 family)